MHDVRVALHGEQLFGLHRAVIADTAQIVAPEIDEHDVLGALFFTGKHFLFQALVLGFVLAAPTRAGDGAVRDISSLNFDEHFRRAAHNGHVVQF